MHTVWLMGGLGNQLFQIQFGSWLAMNSSYPVRFNRYLTRRNNITRMLRWSVHDDILTKVISVDQHLFCDQFSSLAVMFAKIPIFDHFSHFHGSDFFDDFFGSNIFGYFQNPNFNELLYSKRPTLLANPNVTCDKVVMHVRGGDTNDFYSAYQYYCKVLEDLPASEIHVVSDSPALVVRLRAEFPKHVLHNVSSSSVEDFFRLASARLVIAAPSTFSWWAIRMGNAVEYRIPKSLIYTLGFPKPVNVCSGVCY